MKNRYIIIICFALFFINEAQAQDNTFYMDDNSLVSTQAGAILHVEGDLHMDFNSDLDNAGTLNLQGDWYFVNSTVDITGTGGAEEQGTINFENNFAGNPHNAGNIQKIVSTGTMIGNAGFYDVRMANDQGVVELQDGAIEIKNTLDFNNASQILRTDVGVTTDDGEGDYAHYVQISNTSPSTLVGAATSSGTTSLIMDFIVLLVKSDFKGK